MSMPPADHITYADLLLTVRTAAASLRPEELAAPILVGVSGGPDSLALLHALRRWAEETGARLHVCHVDHALRPESATEAARVVALCNAWAIPVSARTVAPGVIGGAGGGLEEGAREERYRLLAAVASSIGARVVALGHHADDQAETLLLHLLRGAGLAGLAGMPIVRRGGDLLDRFAADGARPALWRPLLAIRRATIDAYCRCWSLEPSHDPSNDDRTLRRNAIRHEVIPALTAIVPEAPAILARTAALLADDEDFLAAETARAWVRCATWDGVLGAIDRVAFRGEHRALQRRLVRHGWRLVSGAAASPDAAATETAREAILTGRTGGHWALPGGVTLVLERDTALLGPSGDLDTRLRLRSGLPIVAAGWTAALVPGVVPLDAGWSLVLARDPAPSMVRHIPVGLDSPTATSTVPVDRTARVGDSVSAGTPASDDATAGAMADRAAIDSLIVRTWRPGDRLRLPGGGRQKLQDWFTDRRIPRYVRQHLPLLACDDQILWIAGLAAYPDPVLPSPPQFAGLTLAVLYNGVADERAGVSFTF